LNQDAFRFFSFVIIAVWIKNDQIPVSADDNVNGNVTPPDFIGTGSPGLTFIVIRLLLQMLRSSAAESIATACLIAPGRQE
jgi:hypothetical protein